VITFFCRFKREGSEAAAVTRQESGDGLQSKKKEEIQVIESNRSRNVVFGKRKVHMTTDNLTNSKCGHWGTFIIIIVSLFNPCLTQIGFWFE